MRLTVSFVEVPMIQLVLKTSVLDECVKEAVNHVQQTHVVLQQPLLVPQWMLEHEDESDCFLYSSAHDTARS